MGWPISTVREITSLVQDLIEDGTIELVCDKVPERELSDISSHEELCELPALPPETKEESEKSIIEEQQHVIEQLEQYISR